MFRRAACVVNRSKIWDVWADNGNHLARGAHLTKGLKPLLSSRMSRLEPRPTGLSAVRQFNQQVFDDKQLVVASLVRVEDGHE